MTKYRLKKNLELGTIINIDLGEDICEKVEEEHPVFGIYKNAHDWMFFTLILEFGDRHDRDNFINEMSKTEAFHIVSEYAKAINKYYQLPEDEKGTYEVKLEDKVIDTSFVSDNIRYAGGIYFDKKEYAEQAIKDIPEVFKILLDVE